MLPRSVAVPSLLAASVAVPYVATNAPQWAEQVQLPSAASPAQPTQAPPLLDAAGNPQLRPLPQLAPPEAPGSEIIPVSTPLEGYPTYAVQDVFRMDVTKEWVYQHWPRKSTSLAELGLFGVRVPLVTGPQLHDLAGALTYYFGPTGRVERISFRGRTGDTTQIVMLVQQRFGLKWQQTLTPAEQLLQYRNGDDVLSELRTRPAPVLWESAPHDSFTVELELQQPDTARPLVPPKPTQPTAKPGQAATPAPPEQVAAAEQAAAPPEAEAAAEAADEQDDASGWRAFFPRSRVPKNQLDDLNKPRQLW
ncbi:MAG: hypothetical protein CMJ58_07250 [Planctomycetaceae bacterium]|nr:hypothetical protein [Planctomycetaceae bacterium]